MNWSREINNYCERLGPEYWAEPLNAVTNGAFILAAIWVGIVALRERRLDGPVSFLIGVIGLIGVGSFLFHTHATLWAAVMDTTPIAIFILGYFAIAMNRFGGFGWGMSLALMLGFIVALAGLSWVMNMLLRDVIGGSVSYLPALTGLVAVGLWLRTWSHPAAGWLLGASLIFALSLTARAVDIPYCDQLPFGTHWAWHILNGVVLGMLTLTVIWHGRRPGLA